MESVLAVHAKVRPLSTKTRKASFPNTITKSKRRRNTSNSWIRQPNVRFDKQQIQKCVSYLTTHHYFRGGLKCSNYFGRLASGVVTFYFVCLSFVVDANGGPSLSLSHDCENIYNYYSHVKQKEGAELMKELNSIISPHRSLSYNEVWDALKILDAANVDDPEASSEVVEIYTLRAVSKQLAGKPDGWNREHLWPRSYGLTDGPSLTDLHNLRPADVNVNSSRGNKYYGECVSNSDCLKPANSEAAFDTETDKKRWAPPLQVRGDIARSLMYMSVCYGFRQQNGSLGLRLSDSPSIENREMGFLSALLKWNELDPPSREEQLRNDRICRRYQRNRNPFVDHPEYANLIWKHTAVSSPIVYDSKAWINEFHYKNKGKDRNEFVEIVVGTSTDISRLKLVLYNGANGKMYMSIPLTDRRAFTVNKGGAGFMIYTASLPIQNGPADGMALVSGDGSGFNILQFLSYEGTVKAIDGPAIGIESVDINVRETEDSTGHDSVGLTGQIIGEFKWRNFIYGASPGLPNIGQNISD